ncbi:MAG: GNAT family N-acetyltransferase [Phototrophicaceae bacterium]
MSQLTIRPATLDDLDTIIHHRHQMFADMGAGTPESRAQMDEQGRGWLDRMMSQDLYLGWFACDAENVVAGVGLWLMDWVPAVDGFGGYLPYLLNVYTEPDYRRRGLARQLLTTSLDYCKAHHYPRVRLHASIYGRPLYQDLGFLATNEMQLTL